MAYTASNVTSGKRSGAEKTLEGGHNLKYAQDFEKGTGALQSTPYMKKQNAIQSRNSGIVRKNESKLKQD